MKRLFCLLLAVTLLVCGCGKKETASPTEPAAPGAAAESEAVPGAEVRVAEDVVFDYEAYDWVPLLMADVFAPGTAIGDAGLAAVTLTVDAVSENTVAVTVTAPHIAEELWNWYGVEMPGDAALEAKILELLGGDRKSQSLPLSYQVRTDGQPVVDYTDAYASAVTCGLTDFYRLLQADIIQKLEDSYE